MGEDLEVKVEMVGTDTAVIVEMIDCHLVPRHDELQYQTPEQSARHTKAGNASAKSSQEMLCTTSCKSCM